MKPAAFQYTRPDAISDAMSMLAAAGDDGRVIAGGQSLGPMLNLRLATPDKLVDISRLDDLTRAVIEGDTLKVGACVTHARIEDGEIPDVTRGLMQHIASGIAYRAVRNRGTIGGSLAHADPAADWLSTMMALDASVTLRRSNTERLVKVTDFVTGPLAVALEPGEMIVAVVIPALSAAARWGHAKFVLKLGDFAESMVIAVRDTDRGVCRVVLGRRADVPAILGRTSGHLLGSSDSSEALTSAVESDLNALAIDDEDWILHRTMTLRAAKDMLT